MRLLGDPEWEHWSNSAIARQCGVTHPLVARLRSSLELASTERTFITKYGTPALMNTANIGRRS
jgi:hypothetical protein